MEDTLVKQLVEQGYEPMTLDGEKDLVANLRTQLERFNADRLHRQGRKRFSEDEWSQLEHILLDKALSVQDKTALLQDADQRRVTIQTDEGMSMNVDLIDGDHLARNLVQVTHQFTQEEGAHKNRYDVTILVNGFPMVQIELKRRGKNLREAFHQIERYAAESFWAASGLFDYVQIFVISNGTSTRYYSNTTRRAAVDFNTQKKNARRGTSKSYSFTCTWAGPDNEPIHDIEEFTETFLSKRTLVAMLARYSVFTVDRDLMVMRPYQVMATERILNRILLANNDKSRRHSVKGGGFIWHTTGSGKTLTSWKTAQLASRMDEVDRVLFVVDRKDLDSQTIKEFNKFAPDSVNGTDDTAELDRNLRDTRNKVTVTTIQKLAGLLRGNRTLPVFNERVILIFDECHRSQFGEMRQVISKRFKQETIFGFTGTPIFAENAKAKHAPHPVTTQQSFGDCLHTYTIVDGVRDGNVLPFRMDYLSTFNTKDDMRDEQVSAIATETALLNPERIRQVVSYILEHYGQKTKADRTYLAGMDDNGRAVYKRGFNSLLAVQSIKAARAYYEEFKRQQAGLPENKKIKVATIFSFAPNQDVSDTSLPDEAMDAGQLPKADREFLEEAMADFNEQFGTNSSTDGKGFQNYYENFSKKMKNRELDLGIVVNMFLTGFDAPTLNTLWVDKDLKYHGLIQAFSRTNRILNEAKPYGNIVCFRDLEERTEQAIALFGDKEASGVVKIKPYGDYLAEYREELDKLTGTFEPGEHPLGEKREAEFISVVGAILRLRSILSSFDEFQADDTLAAGDWQDYLSVYQELHDKYREESKGEASPIADDVVFEVELLKQVDINLDYILMLVERHRDVNGKVTPEGTSEIERKINASLDLHSKRDLVMAFVEQVNGSSGNIGEAWQSYIARKRENELEELIKTEHLKEEGTRDLIHRYWADGMVPETGTAVSDIITDKPSRFKSRAGNGPTLGEVKERVVDSLNAFLERFANLG